MPSSYCRNGMLTENLSVGALAVDLPTAEALVAVTPFQLNTVVSDQYYNLTISAPNGLTAPSDGFIDDKLVEDYLAESVPANWGNGTTPPAGWSSAIAPCEAKRRANIRYGEIVAQLGFMGNCYLTDTAAVSGTTTVTAASSLTAFGAVIQVERGSSVLITVDDSNPGQHLSGTAALIRCVARGMVASGTYTINVVNPTQTTISGPSVTVTTVTAGSATPVSVQAASGSTTITSGGTAQQLFAAGEIVNGARLANPTDATENLWFDDTGAAAVTTDGGTAMFIAPGGFYQWDDPPSGAVSVNAATTGHKFQAAKW